MTEEDMQAELMNEKVNLDRGTFQTLGIWLVWIAIGAVVGMRTQDGWRLDSGLEFAIAALSTGGLQGLSASANATCGSPHDQIPDSEAIFTGLYVLTGIPVMGILMGKFANIL